MKTKKKLLKIAAIAYLSFVAYNITDRYIIVRDGYHWETTGLKEKYAIIKTKLVKDTNNSS